MRHPHLTAGAVLAALLLVPAAAAPAARSPRVQELKEADHKKLGGMLEKYVAEIGSPKDQGKVRQDFREELEKIGKKLAGKDGDPMQAALALTEDLEQAVARSFRYKTIRGGKLEGQKLELGAGIEVEYARWLPSSYKGSAGPYPLVLIAPDVKDGKPLGAETFLQEFWTESNLRDGAVLVAVTMPDDVAQWSELFAVDGDGQRKPAGLSYLMRVFAAVREEVAVDADRIYLAGRGPGVAAAMQLGSTFPHLFAGVIGQAGDVGDVRCENFQNLPVFLQGSGGQATAFAEKAKEAGYDNVTLETEADGEKIWSWITDHPRQANPTKVTLVPGSPIPNSAYWVEVPPTDVEEGTYVKAQADRASNTVTVEGQGIRSVVLYFNDRLVDLDKPVKLVLNGEERELVVPRSLDDFLALLERGTNDSGRVYVARRAFDLPPQ